MRLCIGLAEFSSIVAGIEATDAMLKVAEVELLLARAVCPGKFVTIVSGDVGNVTASVRAGVDPRSDAVVDELILPDVHPDVLPSIAAAIDAGAVKALGAVETFSVASGIVACDAAVKAAAVKPLELRVALGIGGRSVLTLTGEVGAVEEAVRAAAAAAARKGLLARTTVIPNPSPDLVRSLT